VNSVKLNVDLVHSVKLASLERFSEFNKKKHSNKNGLLERICGKNSLVLGYECFLIQPLLHSFF